MSTVTRSAVLSPDGRYRYWLTRSWDLALPACIWVMLNPSIADADIDDQTVRQIMFFSAQEGYGSCHVVNLFAFRSADPADLRPGPGPVGARQRRPAPACARVRVAGHLRLGRRPERLRGRVPLPRRGAPARGPSPLPGPHQERRACSSRPARALPAPGAVRVTGCSHGDPTCPCPDGDPCHYEGTNPMPCPLLPACPSAHNGERYCAVCLGRGGCPDRKVPHCHVEGCRWESEGCGLAKLEPRPWISPAWLDSEPFRIPTDSVEWACGAARATVALGDWWR